VTVSAFMTKNPVTLRADDTVGRAAEIMLKNRYLILPVVDAERRYTGVFDMWDLLALLLPKGAVVDHLPGLGFLADDLPALQQKLKGMSEQKVGPLARPDLPMLRPDTSPVEALLLFYRNRSTLPVVDETSGKLVGVLSYWDALAAISGKTA
jgi:CBS domain-containing protein